MDPIDLLFGFGGRLNRARYWLVILIWFVVWILIAVLLFLSEFSIVAIGIAAIVAVPTIVSAIAAGIKRLHDRNKSGWWLLPLYLGTLAGLSSASLFSPGMLQSILSFAGLLFLIWGLIELGCLRGTIAGNPYGPDPVAPKPAREPATRR